MLKHEFGSSRIRCIYIYIAMEQYGKSVTYMQSQTCSLRKLVKFFKTFEYFLGRFYRDTCSRVCHDKLYHIFSNLIFETYLTFISMLACIRQKIIEYLGQPVGIRIQNQ